VINDRGSISVEIASLLSPDDWFDLGVVISYLAGETEAPWTYPLVDSDLPSDLNARTDLKLKHLAKALRPYLEAVLGLFRTDVFERKGEELKEFRRKRWEEYRAQLEVKYPRRVEDADQIG
jgi:hypothetical protein